MTKPPPPTILSLLPCERIIQNGQTGDYSLIDVLGYVRATEFPITAPAFAVFVEFTGARGNLSLMLRVVDADESRPPVREVQAPGAAVPGPLVTGALAVTMRAMTFPAPGEYRIQVWYEGELLRERKLVLSRVEGQQAS